MPNMIESVHAAQRLDSRGNPTIQVDIVTRRGKKLLISCQNLSLGLRANSCAEIGRFRAIVPSGASTGSSEAAELRDHDEDVYDGKGVAMAVDNFLNILGPALIVKKFDPATQLRDIDAFMRSLDGTPTKSRLGANAILGVSMACARAGVAALVCLRTDSTSFTNYSTDELITHSRTYLFMNSYEMRLDYPTM